ncbi:MAG: DOMON-like domain-containing protein [Nitrospirae bacterium]|nr:DOMON-like domain-containing protein [Nitrospirota bacterium]
MKTSTFSLRPFRLRGSLPFVEITGSIGRRSGRLAVSYALSGPPGEIVIPATTDTPARRHALWQETCFEFFLSAKNADQYWEFNLSPAGHWNVYRFRFYRKGMQEEEAFASLPFRVRRGPNVLHLSVELSLDKIVPAEQRLGVGISAVLRTGSGEMIYLSLTHPGPKPDFHRRDGFIIEL